MRRNQNTVPVAKGSRKHLPRRNTRPQNVSADDYRMYLVIRYIAWIGISAHIGFIPLFLYLGVPFMAGFNVLSVSMWFGVRWANKRSRTGLALSLIMTEVTAHAVLAVSFVGWNSGFHYYILALIPFAALNERTRTRMMIVEIAALIAIYLLLYGMTRNMPFFGRPGLIKELVPYINVVVPTFAIGVMTYYFRIATIGYEKALKQQASTDSLTGLFNRRRMLESLKEQHARSKRTEQKAALLLADIDHFKRFNDERGHQFGDVVLCRVASALKQALRQQDVCARWGGEEFLILLPDTDLEGAATVARKLNQAVHGIEFEDADGLKVTLTIGVAMLDPVREIYESIREADNAMYQGKESGRNRVVRWDEATLSEV